MLPFILAFSLALSSGSGPAGLFSPPKPYVPGTARVLPIPTCWDADMVAASVVPVAGALQPGQPVHPMWFGSAPRARDPWDVPCPPHGSADFDIDRLLPGLAGSR